MTDIRQMDLLENAYDIHRENWHILQGGKHIIMHHGGIYVGSFSKYENRLIVINNERETLTLEPVHIMKGNIKTGFSSYIAGFMIVGD